LTAIPRFAAKYDAKKKTNKILAISTGWKENRTDFDPEARAVDVLSDVGHERSSRSASAASNVR